MTIIDEDLLRDIRSGGTCEYCGCTRGPFHAAHIMARGMGGGKRLDVPLNLVCLCLPCHTQNHAGHEPTEDQLLVIAAKRELWKLMRMPKGSPHEFYF